MISQEIRAVLNERLRVLRDTDDEWDYGIEKCWKEETQILSENISGTLLFFETECTDEEFYWLSEVFSDVSEVFQSKEFVQALRSRLAQVTRETYDQKSFKSEHMRNCIDYDEYIRSISMAIDYAEGALND